MSDERKRPDFGEWLLTRPDPTFEEWTEKFWVPRHGRPEPGSSTDRWRHEAYEAAIRMRTNIRFRTLTKGLEESDGAGDE